MKLNSWKIQITLRLSWKKALLIKKPALVITEMFVLYQEFVILNLISFHFSLWKARNFKCMIMEAQRIWRSTIRLGLQYRSSRPKMFLEISQNSHENTCARASFLIKLLKKETLAQVFFSEFFDISKNTFFLQNTSDSCF